jgi:hypothetical protein
VTIGPLFEWDEDKARSNLAKHGVSFNLGATVFDDPFLIVRDDRFAIGEYRSLALGGRRRRHPGGGLRRAGRECDPAHLGPASLAGRTEAL